MVSRQADTSDERLWALLQHVYDAIAKVRNLQLEQQGSSLMQAAVLETIKTTGESASPVQVRKRFIREHNTINALLVRMENRGLLRSTPNPAQKRGSLYSLTEKGNELLEKSKDVSTINKIFAGMSEEDKQGFAEHLLKLRDQALKQFVLQKVKIKISPFINSEFSEGKTFSK